MTANYRLLTYILILDEIIEITLNSANVSHYEKLGYKIPRTLNNRGKFQVKKGTKIYVSPNHLTDRSTFKVNVSCDYCGETQYIKYYDYNRSREKTGRYCCKNCRIKKIEDTLEERYGERYALRIDNFRKKSKETLMKKYGVESPMQLPEVKQKVVNSLYKNQTQATSIQQIYLHNLFGGELNYPISYYSVDICKLEDKIVIEYDGGGHDLSVKMRMRTKEDFDKKELKRSFVIADYGFRIITIISRRDYLPNESVIIKMYRDAKQYFDQGHSWIKFDIDNGIYINSINKDGEKYNFGELKRMKKLVYA